MINQNEQLNPRSFSQKQRQALYLATQGRSMISGSEIQGTFHADHRIPFVHGGLTTVDNGQAALVSENLKKGAGRKPRAWVVDFLNSFKTHPSVNYVLSACPAAGKTIASIEAFLAWRESPDDALAVVSPSRVVRDAWAYVAAPYGIQLDNDYKGFALGKYNGITLTSAALPGLVQSLQLLCSKRRVFVVNDEGHHMGTDCSRAQAFLCSFKSARRRLYLSGTYYRHDNDAIIEGHVIEGLQKPNFVYTYNNALSDGIVKPVRFDFYNGERTVQNKIGVRELTFDTADIENSFSLLLDGDGLMRDIFEHVKGHALEMSTNKKNGAILTTCKDIRHAQYVYNIAREMLGPCGALAVSDENLNNANVQKFQKSTHLHLTAVRQVSEGVDIPRLNQLVYLSNIVTQQYFEQQVGRVTRREPNDGDEVYARVHLPAHPELIKHATAFGELVDQGLKERDEKKAKEIERTQTDYGPTIELSSSATFKNSILDKEVLLGVDLKMIEAMSQNFGLNPVTAKKILDFVRQPGLVDAGPCIAEARDVIPDKIQCKRIGSELKRKVGRIFRKNHGAYDHKEIHEMLNARAKWPAGLKQENAELEHMLRKQLAANAMELE